jgi:hypothetical protein
MDGVEYVKKDVISLDNLARWSSLETNGHQDDPLTDPLAGQTSASSRMPFDLTINQKIILWKGAITRLSVDAIVNTSNEPLTDVSGLAGEILREAGPELAAEVARLEGCRTGEAKITKAYNLVSSRRR